MGCDTEAMGVDGGGTAAMGGVDGIASARWGRIGRRAPPLTRCRADARL
ncbi:MAG TPA: hypothetical protein VID70_02555 [Solirubrobacteraceae bacterium]